MGCRRQRGQARLTAPSSGSADPTMPKRFAPTFKDIQKDIERYLKSEGKHETNEHGQGVFRGYDDALNLMFQRYLKEEAYAPLVAHFRRWNTEWTYNDYLLTLTAQLERVNNWPALKELWSAVVAKRRTHYNLTRKYHRTVPDKIPESSVEKTKLLLLDTLTRLETYAVTFGQQSDIAEYLAMSERVRRGAKA